MDCDRGGDSQRVAQAVGHALRVVTRRVRADEHAEQPVDLANARFDPQRRDLVRDVRDEILRIGKICKRAQLHDEPAVLRWRPGPPARRSPGVRRGRPQLRAARATGGSGATAASVGAPEGRIASTSTSPLPFCAIPILAAAANERSITRPWRNGPRSLTRTTTLLPVATLVTRAYDGSGSVGCAAVIAYMS